MKEIHETCVNSFLSVSRGPEDTCFEYGVFPAILSFPLDYPLSPPKMRFTCEMFHPNSESDAAGHEGHGLVLHLKGTALVAGGLVLLPAVALPTVPRSVQLYSNVRFFRVTLSLPH